MPRTYIRTVLGIITLVFAVVSTVNVYVDPLGAFYNSGLHAQGITRYLQSAHRQEKASMLGTGRFKTVILGTSRAQVGIDPQSQWFRYRDVYNASLSATNVFEIEKVFRYALDHNDLKEIVFGLDFLAFSTQRTVDEDFLASQFASGSMLPILKKYVFSFRTFKKAIRTLEMNRSNRSKSVIYSRVTGFLDKTGSRINHRKAFRQILSKNFFVLKETYAGYRYGIDRVAMLENMLIESAKRNVRVYLFFSPVHAWQLQAIASLGLYDEYLNWKRDIVNVFDRVNRLYRGQHKLMDFSGYNSITTETIPAENEPEKKMRWYWESSHYKKEVGEMILRKLFDRDTGTVPADFGVSLDGGAIEEHIRNELALQKQYQSKFAADVREVEQLARETAPVRAALMQGT